MSGQIKFNLKNNPILADFQSKILQLFFSSPLITNFYLTGGTALSAFYLAHRESKDFDFFTHEPLDLIKIENVLQEIASKSDAEVKIKVRSQTYGEIYLKNKSKKWVQRLDFVQDIPRHFGKIVKIDGVLVDSLENIAANKVNAIFGRLEPKDYLDLYFILKKTALKFPRILRQAQQKDLGINEFYFANIISAAEYMEKFPTLKIDFDVADFRAFYQNLSRDLLLKIKPK